MLQTLLATHSAASQPHKPQPGHVWQLVFLLYCFLATLALWTLAQGPQGIQHLLLLCLLRLAVLVCVGAVTYQAHRRRRGDPAAVALLAAGSPASPRVTLAQAALYLQIGWLASELLLGSALLLCYPAILGPLAAQGAAATATLLTTLLPLLCAAVMSGCFLFLQRLASRRRRQRAPSPTGLECGLGSSGSCGTLAALQGGRLDHSSIDLICSPASDAGSFSSCTSAASSAAFYSRTSSGSLGLSGSGGAPSPTGHVRCSSEDAAAQHHAVVQAACQILLVEHQLDTNEYCLFVHKKLRPIKTRLEAKSSPVRPPGLLRDLITNSFTFQHDPELASQLASGMQAAAGGASSDAASGATSVTFRTVVARASSLLGM